MLSKLGRNLVTFLFSPLMIFNSGILGKKLPNKCWYYSFLCFFLLANILHWQINFLLDNPWERWQGLLQLAQQKKIQVSGTPYDELINKYALANHLDPCLVAAVICQESGFRPQVVSYAGAKGLMQIIPGTWNFLRQKGHIPSDDTPNKAFHPEANIRAGTKYLKLLVDRYQGNLLLALASYNAGPGNIDKYQGIPPFEETRIYVKRVVGYWVNFRGDLPRKIIFSSTFLVKLREFTLVFSLSLWFLLFFWLYRTHSLFRRY